MYECRTHMAHAICICICCMKVANSTCRMKAAYGTCHLKDDPCTVTIAFSNFPTHQSAVNERKAGRRTSSSHTAITSSLASTSMPPNTVKTTKTRSQNETPISEEQQEIKDQSQGRKFLEKHLLLWPAGEPATHTSLATCLYQVLAMTGVPKLAINAIRAVAFLLEEIEETNINTIVKEAFDSQITEFTSDMKLLIEDAKEKIDGHLKETEGRFAQITENTASQVKQAQPNTYASALNAPPPHANPRIAAKEGIKARQFLLEGLSNTKFSHTDVFQLKTEINNILGSLGLLNGKIRSINKLRNRGALVEMDSDASTTWMSDQENHSKLCEKMGPGVAFRSRVHNLIVFNVPLGINPEDDGH
jgi:hypothetical protein